MDPSILFLELILILLLLIIWEAIWKAIGLWKSARKNQLAWFICILIFNTVGILPILYIFIFSEMNGKKSKVKAKKR